MILAMSKRSLALPSLVALALTLTACGQAGTPSSPASEASKSVSAPASSASHDEHEHEGHDHESEGHDHEGHDHEAPGEGKEVGAREPRLALTYDGGVMIVNAETLKPIKTVPMAGKNLRLRPSGDSRYLLVDSGKGLEVLDIGSWTQAHGEHGHSKVMDPSLTGQKIEVSKVGHVSPNADHTLVFDDGDGSVDIFHTEDMFSAEAKKQKVLKPEKTVTLPAHHGNAYMLKGGSIVHTIADKGHAKGVMIIDKDGKKVAENTDCPGTHGAAVAKGGVMTFGCEDGTLLVKDGKITKIKAPDKFARMGNQYGSEDCKYVFSDYKTSEKDLADKVAVIDTEAGTMKVVKLPAAYAWRGIDFSSDGHGIVLTQDGNLHVIDPEHGDIHKTIKALKPFTEPKEWEKPSPTIHAQGHWVYVTDPAEKKVYGIELSVMKVMVTGTLPQVPNEIDGTLG